MKFMYEMNTRSGAQTHTHTHSRTHQYTYTDMNTCTILQVMRKFKVEDLFDIVSLQKSLVGTKQTIISSNNGLTVYFQEYSNRNPPQTSYLHLCRLKDNRLQTSLGPDQGQDFFVYQIQMTVFYNVTKGVIKSACDVPLAAILNMIFASFIVMFQLQLSDFCHFIYSSLFWNQLTPPKKINYKSCKIKIQRCYWLKNNHKESCVNSSRNDW